MLIDSFIVQYHKMECGFDFWKLQTAAEKWFAAAKTSLAHQKSLGLLVVHQEVWPVPCKFYALKSIEYVGDHFSLPGLASGQLVRLQIRRYYFQTIISRWLELLDQIPKMLWGQKAVKNDYRVPGVSLCLCSTLIFEIRSSLTDASRGPKFKRPNKNTVCPKWVSRKME